MTINTVQQLSQLTNTKINTSIYRYRHVIHKSYKCYIVMQVCYNTPPQCQCYKDVLATECDGQIE